MRRDLEFFYERELHFIRRLCAEFASQRPKIADRLLFDDERSQDPHVERLIQAFAFLTARIRLKLDDEFPELSDGLLSMLYPHYLRPVPSMGVVQFVPDPHRGRLTGGYVVPRSSNLQSPEVSVGGRRAARCQFRTAFPVTLWPIEITTAAYDTPPYGLDVRLPSEANQSVAMIRLDLRCNGGSSLADLELDKLRFFLNAPGETGHHLYELLCNHVLGVAVVSGKGPPRSLPPEALQPVGFGADEGLLDYGSQSFLGYRLLTEYFAFPHKFFFLELQGLKRALGPEAGAELQLYVFLDRDEEILASRVGGETFLLGCTPIVNLFRRDAESIRLTHRQYEYRVIPDNRHARDMEVYSVDGLYSLNLDTGQSVEYQPLHASWHGLHGQEDQAYWHTSRRPSMKKDDEGTEVFVSLVDPSFKPRMPPVSILGVRTTCTNRDLPSKLRERGGRTWGFELEGQAPLSRVAPVVLPTNTLRPPLEESRWRLISHLALNHLSITDEEFGADALREILALYNFRGDRASQQQIDGLVRVSSRRKTARVRDGANVAFCRGVQLDLEFDPSKYSGTGCYLLASVLDRFCGLYVTVNSFTQVAALRSEDERPFKVWPPRSGEHQVI